MKIANLLTGLRLLLMAPLFCVLVQGPSLWATALFLLAGLTDIADGWLARRLNQASRFGAFFDLLADRILTLVVGIGLIVANPLNLPVVVACMILIGRNAVVAGLNEALPETVDPRMTWLERIKIACNFIGFAILMTPPPAVEQKLVDWDEWGTLWLCLSALLCLATLAQYGLRARRAFRRLDQHGI